MSSDGGDSPGDGGRRAFGRKQQQQQQQMIKPAEEPERIGGGNYEGPVDDNFNKFLRNLVKERDSLDAEQFPNIHRLIQAELDRASRGSYGVMAQEPVFIDLYNDPPITLMAKAMPPSRLFPKFNYAGRIIGPRGAYLKALMKETSAKMVLLGKGVMKDKEKEEELRRGNDPKYLHLNDDMHVSIHVTASASEAYKRMAYAVSCLKEQVLSDNRSLESLPWISSGGGGGGRMGGGVDGGGSGGGHNPQHQQSQQRYPQSSQRSAGGGYPPVAEPSRSSYHSSRSAAPQQLPPMYDYGPEPGSPIPYRRYPHERSPPPIQRRSEPMKATSYGDSGQWRSMDAPRSSEFDDRRGSSSHMRSRSPPPPSRSYSSAPYENSEYVDPYASYYGSADAYYPPADNGSAYGAMASSRGGKVSSTRYAPYKK